MVDSTCENQRPIVQRSKTGSPDSRRINILSLGACQTRLLPREMAKVDMSFLHIRGSQIFLKIVPDLKLVSINDIELELVVRVRISHVQWRVTSGIDWTLDSSWRYIPWMEYHLCWFSSSDNLPSESDHQNIRHNATYLKERNLTIQQASQDSRYRYPQYWITDEKLGPLIWTPLSEVFGIQFRILLIVHKISKFDQTFFELIIRAYVIFGTRSYS